MFLPTCSCCGSCGLPAFAKFEWTSTKPSANPFCAEWWSPAVQLSLSSGSEYFTAGSTTCFLSGAAPSRSLANSKWDVGDANTNLRATATALYFGLFYDQIGSHSKSSAGGSPVVLEGQTTSNFPYGGAGYEYTVTEITAEEYGSLSDQMAAKALEDKDGNVIWSPPAPTITIYGATFTGTPVWSSGARPTGWDFGNETKTNDSGHVVIIGGADALGLTQESSEFGVYREVSIVGGLKLYAGPIFTTFSLGDSTGCDACSFGYSIEGVVAWLDPSETPRSTNATYGPYNAKVSQYPPSGLTPHLSRFSKTLSRVLCADAVAGKTLSILPDAKTTWASDSPAVTSADTMVIDTGAP
jgi:hypothetical protein